MGERLEVLVEVNDTTNPLTVTLPVVPDGDGDCAV